jgi:hypothetical protein
MSTGISTAENVKDCVLTSQVVEQNCFNSLQASSEKEKSLWISHMLSLNSVQAHAIINAFVHSKMLCKPVAYYYATETNFQRYITITRGKANSRLGKKYCM